MKPHKARRRSRLSDNDAIAAIDYAICRLHSARHMLRIAGSKPAADYVSRAIKSAEGAFNHALRRANEAADL
jgi:hypothetical protein